MDFSKTQIRKLGDRIRSEISTGLDHVAPADIDMLEEYRISYKEYISTIFNKLYKESKGIRHDSITTYRLKRIESIVRKLYRYPSMELDRMSDVAGCRCILNNEARVYKLRDQIYEIFHVSKENDYYKNPVASGYKSIHLYITESENDKWPVEIQIRTKNDHNWATLVEIIDQLYDKSLKEGESDPKFDRFFVLMSILKSLSIEQRVELIHLAHELSVFEKLYSVFVQNYLSVRINWLKVKKPKDHHFFVIEVQGDQPEILSFKSFSDAEMKYFEKFRADSGSNIVLTYLPQSNFDNLEAAYSNYTLTTHTFIDDYFRLLSDVMGYLIRNKKYKLFYTHYSHAQVNLYASFMNIEHESSAIQDVSINDQSKAKYWKKDFRKRINRRTQQLNRISKEIEKFRPTSGYSLLIFNYYVWRINRRERRFSRSYYRNTGGN
ncbi:MAG: RelA/SpoT domain-containing protein [Cyclobacteriaceae bacterium]